MTSKSWEDRNYNLLSYRKCLSERLCLCGHRDCRVGLGYCQYPCRPAVKSLDNPAAFITAVFQGLMDFFIARVTGAVKSMPPFQFSDALYSASICVYFLLAGRIRQILRRGEDVEDFAEAFAFMISRAIAAKIDRAVYPRLADLKICERFFLRAFFLGGDNNVQFCRALYLMPHQFALDDFKMSSPRRPLLQRPLLL